MLKKSILPVLLLAASATVAAQGKFDGDSYCEGVGQVAEGAMYGRQHGLSVTDILARAKSHAHDDGQLELWRAIVLNAFEYQDFVYPEARATAVREFRNTWQLNCLKVAAKRK